MAKKAAKVTCPLCGEENKTTAKACGHCAHPLGKPVKEDTAPSPDTAPPPPERKVSYAGMGGLITVPAGKPICAPKVVKDFTDQDVADWAYDVIDKGHAQGKNYSLQAVKYWARYFWDSSTDDHRRVLAILDNLVKQGEQ
jgi:hypothetical protein